MKKIIILFISIFFLTGCNATYNIEIYNNQVKEDLEYISTNPQIWDSKVQYNLTYRDLVLASHKYPYPAFNSTVVLEDDTIKLDDVEYYENNLISDSSSFGQTFSYHKFTLENFNDSSIVKKCYQYFNVIEKNDEIIFSTSLKNKCFEEYQILTDITIKLKTNHKVVSSNADIVDGYHYTWNISKKEQEDAAILLTIKKDEYVFNYENEFIKKLIYIASIAGAVAVVSGITYKYFKHKRKKMNEI